MLMFPGSCPPKLIRAYVKVGFILTMKRFVNKVSKGAKIRNRYNQLPHLTKDTYWRVTNSQLDTTDESEEVSPFTADDQNAQINRPTKRHT